MTDKDKAGLQKNDFYQISLICCQMKPSNGCIAHNNVLFMVGAFSIAQFFKWN